MNPNVLIVGQTLRIPGAKTNNEGLENPAADREEGESSDYVIEAGDTLGSIANTYQVSTEALADANPEVDPNNLQINQLLVIPPRGTGLPPGALEALSTPVPIPREPGEVQTHAVAAGDNLGAIAAVYSVTIDEILEANGLEDPNQITVGQQLLIPPPSQAAAASADG